MRISIEKHWSENERIREGANGRVYVSTRGRWEWVVVVDGDVESIHDRKRDANERAEQLREIAPVPVDKYEHAPCAFCRADCSTHPDAANPLAYCGDCGRVACPDHKVDDEADRCVDCAATFYRNAEPREASRFSPDIRAAFDAWTRTVERATEPGLRLPQRTARRAAQTRASKAFARVCYQHGFEDAQGVADALTREEASK